MALRDLLSKGGIGYGVEKLNISENDDGNTNGIKDSKYFEKNSNDERNFTTKNVNNTSHKIFPDTPTLWGTSSKKAVFMERIIRNVLHKYFLISRPLTMGVRCVILNDDREVLLVKHTYISGWHLPGGGIDSGESAEDGVVREVEEETGLVLEDKPILLGIFHNKETTNRDHVVLFCSKISESVDLAVNTFEIKSLALFSLEDLPIDIDVATKEWIACAT